MASRKFRDIKVGEKFQFGSESRVGYGGARGPWIKTGTRTYRHEEDSEAVFIKVGSINAEVMDKTLSLSRKKNTRAKVAPKGKGVTQKRLDRGRL